MRGQTLTDTQLILELVGEAYGFEDLGQFRSGVLEVLNRMVPSEWASYNEVSAEPEETFVVAIPEIPEYLISIFSKLAHENPLLIRIRRTGDGRPYRFSDVIAQQAFHGLALYQEVYRPLGVESQIAFTLPARSPLVLGIALSRGHQDFSDREVQLLSLARPHLIQAYRNAELWGARTVTLAALEEGLDTLGRHVVVLDLRGRVEFATDGARRLLGDPDATHRRLTENVRAWISAHRGSRAAAEPFVLQSAGGRARALAAEPRFRSAHGAVPRKGNGRVERCGSARTRAHPTSGRHAASPRPWPLTGPDGGPDEHRDAHR